MASLIREPNGRRLIQFSCQDGRRPSIRLGKIGQRAAEEVRRHVEYLLAAREANAPLDAHTAAWLDGIGDQLRGRLAAVGLCEAIGQTSLGPWLEAYLAGRTDLTNANTRNGYRYAARHLAACLGADRDLRTIGPADADRWLVWAKTNLAPATVAQELMFARHFWRKAISAGVARSNPFEALKGPKVDTRERQHFIDHATAMKILEACPDWRWRLLFSLARWGGMRIPSEPKLLTWEDVLFDVHRVRARGKTGPRWLPLFPELLGPLQEAWDRAPEGQALVLPAAFMASNGLRGRFERLIRRTLGREPWPRLWHNLRASRQTELEDQGFPTHVVCRWLGNSPAVARKHYLQPHDEHFERACRGGAKSGASSAGNVQSTVQDEHGPCSHGPTEQGEPSGDASIPTENDALGSTMT